MHIKIEDQETGLESVLCVDRTAKTATILKLVPGHENLLVQIAQSVGATSLVMIARHDYGVEFLWPYGFRADSSYEVFVKEL